MAPQRDERALVERFLAQVESRTNVPVGTRERILAQRLAAGASRRRSGRPRWLRWLGGDRARRHARPAERALGVAVCSVLARTHDEWVCLAEIFEDVAGGSVGLLPDRPDLPHPDTSTAFRRFRGALARLVVVAAGVGGAVLILPIPEREAVRQDGGSVARPDAGLQVPVAVGTASVTVCMVVESTRTVTLATDYTTRRPAGGDWAWVALAGALTTLGFALLIRLPQELRERHAEVERLRDQSDTVANQDRTFPLRATPLASRHAPEYALLVETASLLHRIGADTYGPDLDGLATVRATADAGGRWSPVLATHRLPETLTVLVDGGDGGSVWLPPFRRLLDEYDRHGCRLAVYTFAGHPDYLRSQPDAPSEPLKRLAGRHFGPVLIFSSGLQPFERSGALASWVKALSAWSCAAWLNPEPDPARRSSRHERLLEALGVPTFPASPDGLKALCRFLSTDGMDYTRVVWPALPNREAPEIRAALQYWRLAVALVPNPTWDLVEQLRRSLPKIGRVLKDPWTVRLLLDEAAAEEARVEPDSEARRADAAGRGHLITLSRTAYLEWTAALHRLDPAFEGRVRELLISELRREAREVATDREKGRVELRMARQQFLLDVEDAEARARLGAFLCDPRVPAEARREIEDVLRLLRMTGRGRVAETGSWAAQAPISKKQVRLHDLWSGSLKAWIAAVASTLILGALIWIPGIRGRVFPEANAVVVPETCRVGRPRDLRPRMRTIPKGSFIMGSPSSETGRHSDEVPHPVQVPAFSLGETEVTQAQWFAVMGNNPARFSKRRGGSESNPVERVSWFDALAYLNRLSEAEGLEQCYRLEGCSGRVGEDFVCTSVKYRGAPCAGYRLPTEAEWEYAARANTKTAVYAGDLIVEGRHNAPVLDAIAWYGGNSGVQGATGVDCRYWREKQFPSDYCATKPVGQKNSNGFGLYDMIGNVWEWTNDAYTEYPKTGDPGATAWDRVPGPAVLRGCSWDNGAVYCRAADRSYSGPADHSDDVGFRPARSIP